MYNFKTTARQFYFSRNNDFIYNIRENFILKIKPILEKDREKKIIASFVLSRKVGSAVERNKIKRRLRVIFHGLASNFLHKDFAYIIIVKKNLTKLSFDEIKNEILISLNEMFANKKFKRHLEKLENTILEDKILI